MKANLVTAAISLLLAAFTVSAADNDLPRLKKSDIDGYYYADPDGTITFGTGFRRATAFNSDGVAAVSFDGNRFAIINKHGAILSEFTLPSAPTSIYKGVALFKNKGKEFLMSISGDTLSPMFDRIKLDDGLITVRKGLADENFTDGTFRPLIDERIHEVTTRNLSHKSGGKEYNAVVGVVRYPGKRGTGVVDMDGNNIFAGKGMLAHSMFGSQYSSYITDFRKAEVKSGHRWQADPDLLVVGSPDGGSTFGIYLLDGTEIVAPKAKSEEKACKALAKEFQKKLVPRLDDGTYARSTENAMRRLDSITAARRAANLAQLGIAPDFDYIRLPVLRYFCRPEEVAAAPARKAAKGKKRGRSRAAAEKTYVLSSEFTTEKFVSEKFAEIKDMGVFFACRRPGEKKYNLFNTYCEQMTFDGYDDIKVWNYNSKSEEIFLVRDGNNYGLLSTLGTEILPPQYSGFKDTTIEPAIGVRDGKHYLIDSETGRLLGGIPYDTIDWIASRGMLDVSRMGYDTKVDKNGKESPSIAHLAFNKVYELHQNNGDPQKILEGYIDVLALCNDGDKEVKGAAYCNVGALFVNAGQTDKEKEYYRLAVKYGSSTAASNLQGMQAQEKSSRWEAFGNALNAFSQAASAFSGGQGFMGGFAAGMSGDSGASGYSSGGSAYGGESYQSEGGSSTPKASGGMSEASYRDIYSRWERQAKSTYESLTMQGTRTSRGGKAESGTTDGFWRHHYAGLKKNLREAQTEMRKTRQEARRAGYTIPQSNYETVTVSM